MGGQTVCWTTHEYAGTYSIANEHASTPNTPAYANGGEEGRAVRIIRDYLFWKHSDWEKKVDELHRLYNHITTYAVYDNGQMYQFTSMRVELGSHLNSCPHRTMPRDLWGPRKLFYLWSLLSPASSPVV